MFLMSYTKINPMIERGISWYVELLSGTGLSDGLMVFIENATIILITVILALLADFIVKRIIISSIARLAKRSKNDWDDVFVKQKVFNRLAHLAPALIVFYSLQYIFDAEKLVTFLGNLTQTYMILVVLLVIDSVAALVPRAEIEGEMGDSHMGLQARLMSQALRKLTGTISKTETSIIFINQIRMKIGVVFGNPETTTGGNALKFYSSVRLDIRRSTAIKDGQEIVGNRTRVKVVKNKMAPPFKNAEFDIMYGEGISRTGDLLDVGVEEGIVEKSGSWYSYNGERIGQGRENVKAFLTDNPDIYQDAYKRVREAVGLDKKEAAEGEEGQE